MSAINDLLTVDWYGAVRVIFLIMASLIAIHEVCSKFAKMVKQLVRRLKGLDPNPKNQEQDAEIKKIKKEFEELKKELEELKKMLRALKKSSMVNSWDRIIHFGMNYIRDGHISYCDKELFVNEVEAYKDCGGNGHLKKFGPMVTALPYTEDLTEEQRISIEDDMVSKKQRINLAEAALTAYCDKGASL